MFVISQSPSYVWPVVVEEPVDGGKFVKHTFDAEFKRLPQSRIIEFGGLLEKGDLTDAGICAEVLVGWKGVVDEKGEAIPFSEAARDKLLNVQLVAGSIVRAFMASIAGSKAKN